MKILATHNIKGGVGKTSSAVNLAYLAARDGYRTLLWDLDPQAAATYCFRIKPKVKGGVKALGKESHSLENSIKGSDYEGLDLIPGDFSLRNFDQVFAKSRGRSKQLENSLLPLQDDYDLMIIDCAPSISLMTENIFHVADALLIPLIPSAFSVRTYHQMLKYFSKERSFKLRRLPFFSMYDKRRELQRDVVAAMSNHVKELLNTAIPYAKNVELMAEKRMPVSSFAPTSKSGLAFRDLWREIKVKALDDHNL
jgi:cellulose biosynthesis protein BcsQ